MLTKKREGRQTTREIKISDTTEKYRPVATTES